MPDDLNDDLMEEMRAAAELAGLEGRVLRTSDELARQFPKQERGLICHLCGANLILKDGRYGLFYGCKQWAETRCKGSQNCNRVTAEIYELTQVQQVCQLIRAIKEKALSTGETITRKWLRQTLNLREDDPCHSELYDSLKYPQVKRLSETKDYTKFIRDAQAYLRKRGPWSRYDLLDREE